MDLRTFFFNDVVGVHLKLSTVANDTVPREKNTNIKIYIFL